MDTLPHHTLWPPSQTREPPPGRVCIALPAQGSDYDEMARVLTAVLQEVGTTAYTARDGQRAVLDCDILIMFGKCSAFTRSARLLATRGIVRPRTILWHIEPLLPELLPKQAERTCRLLAKCDWAELPQPYARLAKAAPGSTLVRDAIRHILSSRLIRQSAWVDASRYGQIHSRQWFHAAQHCQWLKDWHNRQWCDLVAASTRVRHDLLTRMGIPCAYAPLGYHPEWGRDLGIRRDIDVLFLGRVKRTSRVVAVRRLRRQLAQRGIELTVVEGDCFGSDRTGLLNRTRIVVDLVQNTWEMPVLRLLVSMACGALVVSNWTDDPHPFDPEHLVQADTSNLADTIAHYLGSEPERLHIARPAQRHVTTNLTWHDTIRGLLRIGGQRTSTAIGVAT